MRTTRRPVAVLLAAAVAAMLFSLAGTTPARAAEEQKIRVAVLDFNTEALEPSWSYGWHVRNLARAAADALTTKLVQTGRFRVIERQQLDKILKEQDLADSGRIDPSTAARIGKVLGVQAVIIGSVTEFGISKAGGRIPQIGRWKWGRGLGARVVTGKTTVTARLIDTTTAEILGAYEASGKHTFGKGEFSGARFGKDFDSGLATKVLAKAVGELAEQIAADAGKISVSTVRGGIVGKVAKVAGDKVYLNVGDMLGVKVGDRFEIRGMGEVIRDPDTGEVLGGEEETRGVVEVIKVLGGRLSVARPVSGSGFQAGDRAVMK